MTSIKEGRERLKMTQGDLAQLLEMRQDALSRLEKSKLEDISSGTLAKIADIFGLSLEEILNRKKQRPQAFEVNNSWEIVENFRDCIGKYLQAEEDSDKTLQTRGIIDYIEELLNEITMKPFIIFSGSGSPGKSTMINHILGQDICPTGMESTTAVPFIIKHVDERSEKLRDYVYIFKKAEGSETININIPITFESIEEHTEILKVYGGYELIEKYGTKNGECQSDNIAAILVYANSSILKVATLIDTPSPIIKNDTLHWKDYSTGFPMDIKIFLSPAQEEFLSDARSLITLRSEVEQLPCIENANESFNNVKPLGNLFIVESKSHLLVTDFEFDKDKRINVAIKRFRGTLPNTLSDFFSSRNEEGGFQVSGEDEWRECLESRVFSYAYVEKELHEEFQNELCSLLESLPEIIVQRADTALTDYSEELKRWVDKQEEFAKSESSVADMYSLLLSQIKDILKSLRTHYRRSVNEFREKYDEIISTDNIVGIIIDKELSSRVENIHILHSALSISINYTMDTILKSHTNKLEERMRELTMTYGIMQISSQIQNDTSTDTRSFVGGELPLYLSLRKKPTGILGSILMGVGLLAGGLLAYIILKPLIFGGSNWKEKTARTLKEMYRVNDFQKKCEDHIYNYWISIEKQLERLQTELKNRFDQSDRSDASFESNITTAKAIIKLLDGLPKVEPNPISENH